QRRPQQLIDGPTLFLDEVRHQQPVARIGSIPDPHLVIHDPIAERVAQLLERLPVLDPDIVGKPLPDPLWHVQTAEAEMLPGDDVGDLVRAEPPERARRRADIAPMNDAAALEVGAAQEGMTAEPVIPGKAPTVRVRNEEQALAPAVIG